MVHWCLIPNDKTNILQQRRQLAISGILQREVSSVGTGALNVECPVPPPGSKIDAMPEDAHTNAIFPRLRVERIMQLYKNVLPVPPGPSTKWNDDRRSLMSRMICRTHCAGPHSSVPLLLPGHSLALQPTSPRDLAAAFRRAASRGGGMGMLKSVHDLPDLLNISSRSCNPRTYRRSELMVACRSRASRCSSLGISSVRFSYMTMSVQRTLSLHRSPATHFLGIPKGQGARDLVIHEHDRKH